MQHDVVAPREPPPALPPAARDAKGASVLVTVVVYPIPVASAFQAFPFPRVRRRRCRGQNAQPFGDDPAGSSPKGCAGGERDKEDRLEIGDGLASMSRAAAPVVCSGSWGRGSVTVRSLLVG